jgi:hypothetical protein
VLVLFLNKVTKIMFSFICVLVRLLFRCVLCVVILNYDNLLGFFFAVLILEQ